MRFCYDSADIEFGAHQSNTKIQAYVYCYCKAEKSDCFSQKCSESFSVLLCVMHEYFVVFYKSDKLQIDLYDRIDCIDDVTNYQYTNILFFDIFT